MGNSCDIITDLRCILLKVSVERKKSLWAVTAIKLGLLEITIAVVVPCYGRKTSLQSSI